MIFQQFAEIVAPQTMKTLKEVVLSYNGMRSLSICHRVSEDTLLIHCVDVDFGEKSWNFSLNKEVFKDLSKDVLLKDKEKEIGLRLEKQDLVLFFPDNLDEGKKMTLVLKGSPVNKPNWTPEKSNHTVYLELTPAEWGQIEAAASIVKKDYGSPIHKGVNLILNNDLLEIQAVNLRSKKTVGLQMSQIMTLENGGSTDSLELNIIVPVEAINLLSDGKTAVNLEVSHKQILLSQGNKSVFCDLIEGEYPIVGLIPDGEAKVELEVGRLQKFLYPKEGKSLEPSEGVIINVNFENKELKMAALSHKNAKAPQGIRKNILVPKNSDKYPSEVTLSLAASVLLDVVRLIGLGSMAKITLSLPIGLQFLTIAAGAIRFVLPTTKLKAVSEMKNAAALSKEIINPEPLRGETASTTVDVGTEDNPKIVELTIEEIEESPADNLEEPASQKEAVEQLEDAVSKGKKTLAVLPKKEAVGEDSPDPMLATEVAARGAIEEKLEEAKQILDQANLLPPNGEIQLKGCPLSPKDISKLTAALVRLIRRTEGIVLNLQTWTLHVTFSSEK
jgi:hypothetical protein